MPRSAERPAVGLFPMSLREKCMRSVEMSLLDYQSSLGLGPLTTKPLYRNRDGLRRVMISRLTALAQLPVSMFGLR